MKKNEVLEKQRIAKDLSITDMAKALNISKVYYWQIENNKRRLYYDLAFKIAEILETTPDKLFYYQFKNKDQ